MIKKEELSGRYQLLQCPSPREPLALPEERVLCLWTPRIWYVLQKRIAYFCILVPREHRVDRLRELFAARFVDAARIDPDIIESVLLRSGTATLELLETF